MGFIFNFKFNKYMKSVDILIKEKNCREAIKLNEEIAEIVFSKKTYHDNFYYNKLAEVYFRLNNPMKAKECYEKVIEFYKRTSSQADDNIATAYKDIGMLKLKMGQLEMAKKYFEKSFEILEEYILVVKDTDKPITADSREDEKNDSAISEEINETKIKNYKLYSEFQNPLEFYKNCNDLDTVKKIKQYIVSYESLR